MGKRPANGVSSAHAAPTSAANGKPKPSSGRAPQAAKPAADEDQQEAPDELELLPEGDLGLESSEDEDADAVASSDNDEGEADTEDIEDEGSDGAWLAPLLPPAVRQTDAPALQDPPVIDSLTPQPASICSPKQLCNGTVQKHCASFSAAQKIARRVLSPAATTILACDHVSSC